jgi:hypothetical protein
MYRFLVPLASALLLTPTFAAPPANDNFVDAIELTGLPADTTGDNTEATLEPGEPDPSTGDGGTSIWWRWTAPSSGLVEINTLASEVDTILAVYTGSTLSGLTRVAWNDDAPGGLLQSKLTFSAVSGTAYRIQAQGFGGEEGSIPLAILSGTPATPPVLQRLTITPASVNVTSSVATITAEIQFTAPDGLRASETVLTLTHSSGDEIEAVPSPVVNVSGTPTGGVFRFDVTIPQGRAPGSWRATVNLVDEENQEVIYGATGSPALPSGSTTALTVINTGAVDLTPPTLISATITPGTVNVTAASQTVTVRVTASDDRGVSDMTVSFNVPPDGEGGNVFFDASDLVSGTVQSGTWQKTFTVPRYVTPGDWKIDYALFDASQHFKYYVEGVGYPAAARKVLVVQNTGAVDNEGPLLTAVSTDKTTVDVSGGSATVQFNATFLDALAGMAYATVTLWNVSDDAFASSAILTDASAPFPTVPVNTSVAVTIPAGLTAGTYYWSVYAYDGSIENTSEYSRYATPFPGGFVDTLTVTRGGSVDAYATWRATWPALAGASGLEAADPDGDGLPNAMEFLCGTDPLLHSRPGGPDPAAARAPVYTRTPTHLRVEYRLSAANAALGTGTSLTLQPQTSGDLALPWTDLEPVSVSNDLWRVEIPFASASRRFLRFAVPDGA